MSDRELEKERVCEALSRFVSSVVANGAQVDRDAALSDLGIDSFGLIELVLVLERTFGRPLELGLLTPENTRSLSALADCYVQACSETL